MTLPPAELTESGFCAALVACGQADPDWWHPTHQGAGGCHPVALWACRQCPVVRACGEFAEQIGDVSGIWGGRRFTTNRYRHMR